jgi:transglutaminase-like putative cysteine protease
VSFLEAVRRANQPGPPEHSVRLRLACTLTVLVSIVASTAEGEVSHQTALLGGSLVVAGMVFSYRTRSRPPGWIKLLAAFSAVSVLLWFFHQLTARPITDITTVEDPLTVMFIAILVVHSFHVPARRDLIFAIAASAALIAVAAAQAIDLTFSFYAGAWLGLSIWSLMELWRSISAGGKVSPAALGSAAAGICISTALVFFLQPAPVVSIRISFQSRASSAGPVPIPGALAGDAGSPSQLSKPGSPSGRARVGGYLGFANSLDTALRGELGNTVVMRVRAERPSYWVGETFDTWNGQSWLATKTVASHQIRESSPFAIPLPDGDMPLGQSDLQTFYVATPSPDLIFHADSAKQLWFPATSVYFGDDGTLVSPIGLGKGAIYTVESSVITPTPDELRQQSGSLGLSSSSQQEYTQLPGPYRQAATLARSVTAGAGDTYDKVEALIGWIGANTRYSTDIPPLPRGADTVNEFLFGNRVGFCEQISTSLTVMLRTLGIPSREVVGYVPDSYNPITDLYEVRAKDAHAWVQVWFPGSGWHSFDPTAVVPVANPSPGRTALTDAGRALGKLPWAPIGVLAALAVGVVIGIRCRRSLPKTWGEKVARSMEQAGRKSIRPRRPSETMLEYASVLDFEHGMHDWAELAAKVTSGVYGGLDPPVSGQEQMIRTARQLKRRTHNRAKPRRSVSRKL